MHSNSAHYDKSIFTWENLVNCEPGLHTLLKEARNTKDTGIFFCKDAAWQGSPNNPGFKKRMDQFVGWGSMHRGTFLNTSEAWEVVRDKILEALPDCRNCGCEVLCADGKIRWA